MSKVIRTKIYSVKISIWQQLDASIKPHTRVAVGCGKSSFVTDHMIQEHIVWTLRMTKSKGRWGYRTGISTFNFTELLVNCEWNNYIHNS